MKFENSGNFLHQKHTRQNLWKHFRIQKHLHGILFPHTPQMLEGLQTAGPRSVNYLRKVVGVTAFPFPELSTLLTQEEACLNSHPLTALSNDPNDLTYLSPVNF
jgi:hypothetical protein